MHTPFHYSQATGASRELMPTHTELAGIVALNGHAPSGLPAWPTELHHSDPCYYQRSTDIGLVYTISGAPNATDAAIIHMHPVWEHTTCTRPDGTCWLWEDLGQNLHSLVAKPGDASATMAAAECKAAVAAAVPSDADADQHRQADARAASVFAATGEHTATQAHHKFATRLVLHTGIAVKDSLHAQALKKCVDILYAKATAEGYQFTDADRMVLGTMINLTGLLTDLDQAAFTTDVISDPTLTLEHLQTTTAALTLAASVRAHQRYSSHSLRHTDHSSAGVTVQFRGAPPMSEPLRAAHTGLAAFYRHALAQQLSTEAHGKVIAEHMHAMDTSSRMFAFTGTPMVLFMAFDPCARTEETPAHQKAAHALATRMAQEYIDHAAGLGCRIPWAKTTPSTAPAAASSSGTLTASDAASSHASSCAQSTSAMDQATVFGHAAAATDSSSTTSSNHP